MSQGFSHVSFFLLHFGHFVCCTSISILCIKSVTTLWYASISGPMLQCSLLTIDIQVARDSMTCLVWRDKCFALKDIWLGYLLSVSGLR